MSSAHVPTSITVQGAPVGANARTTDSALGRARKLAFWVAFTVPNGRREGREKYRLVDSKRNAEGIVIRFAESLAPRVTIQLEDQVDQPARQAWAQLVTEGTLRGWVVVE